MRVSCPVCDEYTLLPEIVSQEYGHPLCEYCGNTLYGYDSFYTQCRFCGTKYENSRPICPYCGRSKKTKPEVSSRLMSLNDSDLSIYAESLLKEYEQEFGGIQSQSTSFSSTSGHATAQRPQQGISTSPRIATTSPTMSFPSQPNTPAWKPERSSTEQYRINQLCTIRKEVIACKKCHLYKRRTKAVPGAGPFNAQVMFIGEAPGYHEDKSGRPFVGASGRYLNDTLFFVGLSRESVYITNVIKCRPPKNRDPLPNEVELCSHYIYRELFAVNPQVIVTLGRFSMRLFLSGVTITEAHGKPRYVKGQIIFPMYHPAAVLRNQALIPVFRQDMERVVDLIKHGMPTQLDNVSGLFANLVEPKKIEDEKSSENQGEIHTADWHSYTLNGQTNEVDLSYKLVTDNTKLDRIIKDLAAQPIVSIDTETTGLDPISDKLLLLQIATPEKVYIFDGTAVDAHPLKSVLENEQILKLLQNAKFDYKFIKQQLGISLNNIYDTMLAERVLTAGISRRISLAAMSKDMFNISLDKSIRISFTEGVGHLSDEQLKYAAEDVVLLFFIYEQQQQRLKHHKLEHIAKLEFDAVIPIAEMELAGIGIDVAAWKKMLADHQALRDQAEHDVIELLSPGIPQTTMFEDVSSINLGSQPQVMDAFAHLGIHLENTSEDTLKQVDHPAAKKLLDFREHDKIVTSFGDKFLKFIHPVTGRLHPNFQQYGADTGRLSCSKPNVQQIPGKFRYMLTAAPGYKVITCDYSQAELRILAHLSNDPGFCEAFRSGGDLHSITAAQMFKIPLEEVTKPKRSQAKAINFGLAYGRGPGSLAVQLGVSKDEAVDLIEHYFKAYAKVGDWLEKAAEEAVDLGYSITPLGRKRFYRVPSKADPDYRRKISSIQRKGKNTPIQGANADMIKYAFIYLHEGLKPYDARLINTVHDEVVVEVREDQAEEVAEVVERIMIQAAELIVTAVPIKSDAMLEDYWTK